MLAFRGHRAERVAVAGYGDYEKTVGYRPDDGAGSRGSGGIICFTLVGEGSPEEVFACQPG